MNAGGADAQPLRSLVVEDEWPARNYLVELLEASQLAQVVGAVASAEEAHEALGKSSGLSVDVAFVDVQLGSADRAGLELARALLQARPGLMIVLATAFEQHALAAFDLGVLDYLLKPFSEERVQQCLRRLHARKPAGGTAVQPPPRIVARRKKNLVFLAPDEIWAFEAADRLTFVHTAHGRFDLDLSLAAIEISLGRALTRVHRNWLVNVAFIRELERDGAETRLFVGSSLAGSNTAPALRGATANSSAPAPRGGALSEGLHVPVARERAQQIKDMLLANTTGLRRP